MKLKKTLSENELNPLIDELVKNLSPQTMVLLNGPLGSGKTFLITKILKSLGVKKTSSPTYSLIHEHESPQYSSIFHVDLYRLNDDEDIESTGFWDLFESKNSLLFIEWAERLKTQDLPMNWKILNIKISVDNTNSTNRTYDISIIK